MFKNVNVKFIAIKGFRGIPQELRISLERRNSKVPQSLVLFGDNGTGKSSIVDALEFSLQGRIGRSMSIEDELRASAISFANSTSCEVTVGLSDGTDVLRSIVREEDVLSLSEYLPHPAFAVSPFVLRRPDVLRFHDVPDQERQSIFFDYFMKPREGWAQNPQEKLKELMHLRSQLKGRVLELREQVAEKLFWDVDTVPEDENLILEFRRTYLYK